MSKKKLDEFLAAPEQLKKNKVELKKAVERKAKEEARKRREGAGKQTKKPSVEDMLADIVRVAEDEDINPFAEFRSISARRYELYGHHPMEHLTVQFGTFHHALEVAGLRDQPGTRLLKCNRAKESRREHAARYMERYIAPYVARRDEILDITGRSYRILSISDTHSTLMDPFVWLSFLSAIRELKRGLAAGETPAHDLNRVGLSHSGRGTS